MLDRLKRSLESSPIVRMGSYDYFVNPITDGIPKMDPMVLAEVLEGFKEIGDFHCDLLIAPEAMGLPLVVPLSLELGIPYNVVRKKKYGLPGEMSVTQLTGYSKSQMYLNGIEEGEKVVLVDDVISTGGTISAIVKALQAVGADIVDILIVVEKGDHKQEVERDLGVRIKTLVKVEVRDGQLIVLN
jgi:adenine phosphoribosyltransferase